MKIRKYLTRSICHFIRNKFEVLVNGLRDDVDIIMISETKIDDSFTPINFLLEGFTTTYRLDPNGSGMDRNGKLDSSLYL